MFQQFSQSIQGIKRSLFQLGSSTTRFLRKSLQKITRSEARTHSLPHQIHSDIFYPRVVQEQTRPAVLAPKLKLQTLQQPPRRQSIIKPIIEAQNLYDLPLIGAKCRENQSKFLSLRVDIELNLKGAEALRALEDQLRDQTRQQQQQQQKIAAVEQYAKSWLKEIQIFREFKYSSQLTQYPSVMNSFCRRDDAVCVTLPNCPDTVSFRSFSTLSVGKWLNDQVVNLYIRLINQKLGKRGSRMRVANSHFIGTLKSSKLQKSKIDRILKKMELTTDMDLIVPINRDNVHWSFCFITNRVLLLDSMISTLQVDPVLLQFCTSSLNRQVQVQVGQFPKQNNSYDCGVMMLCGMRELSQGRSLNFRQQDMGFKRIQIGVELLEGRLL